MKPVVAWVVSVAAAWVLQYYLEIWLSDLSMAWIVALSGGAALIWRSLICAPLDHWATEG